MAVNWEFQSKPVEFRAFRERTNKEGVAYGTIVVEDDEGYQNEISCRETERFPQIRRLRRGNWYMFPLVVFASEKWQFTRLDEGPIVHVNDDGVTSEV